MQSNREFKFKPSMRYLCLLSVVLFATGVIIEGLPFGVGVRMVMLGIFIPYSGWMLWRFALLRGKDSILRLKHERENYWLIETPRGAVRGELCKDSTVTQFACVLRFKVPGQFWTQTAIVFHDSLSKEQYQQLIVILRMY